jgi:hypothetical protein
VAISHFCTYFDRNYVTRAMALTHSLRRHHADQFRLFTVCLDDVALNVMRELAMPEVEPIPIAEIERGDDRLIATKSGRSRIEYYWTCTPTIILRILEQHPSVDTLIYVDADLYFYNSAETLIHEMASNAVLIHEHRFSKHIPYLSVGRFNVGLLCFKNDDRGIEVLTGWRNDCIDWCYRRAGAGKYGDQTYLNIWPERYPWICITSNIGAGVAPWNQDQYRVTNRFGYPFVSEQPVVFYHFHELRQLAAYTFVPHRNLLYRYTLSHVENIFVPYFRELANVRIELTGSFTGLRGTYDVGDFSRCSIIELSKDGCEVTPSIQLTEGYG